MRGRTGRPPKKVDGGGYGTLSLKIPAEDKNLLIDQAQAYDLSLTEYLVTLIRRDAEAAPTR